MGGSRPKAALVGGQLTARRPVDGAAAGTNDGADSALRPHIGPLAQAQKLGQLKCQVAVVALTAYPDNPVPRRIAPQF